MSNADARVSESARFRSGASRNGQRYVQAYSFDGRVVQFEVTLRRSESRPRVYRISPAGSTLTSLSDGGALLSWVFDSDPVTGVDSRLLVVLTDSEAEDTVCRDSLSGLIESFRKAMAHPFGIVRSAEGTTPFFVEPYASEAAFTDMLIRAADDPRAYLQDARQWAANGDASYERLLNTFGMNELLDLESKLSDAAVAI